WIVALVALAGGGMAMLLSKPLNGLLLGENYARSMGLSVFWSRILIIVSTSLLAGGITAFTGPLGFIGIAVPHLTRSLLGTDDHRVLIPATVIMGALLLLACVLVARMPGAAPALPSSAVTSFVGGPVVIGIILERKNWKASF